ncbi:C-C motif chemokine 20b [Sparus aurata]|uniref:C-C motif chemokine n=1 Tax=Sparus aurata TaxID=8175 RepID=D5J733_SPAAU|nr:C-C motif chemokine 20-like [Sparus aurata]ADE58983.1 CC chemokine CK1 [Sparus aurata]
MACRKDFLLTALLSLLVLSTFIDNTQSASCCLRYVRRPRSCTPMLGYTIQTINHACDIEAIIFHLPGRFVCANPKADWTQRGVACLDERRRKTTEIIEATTQANTTSA